MVLKFKLPINFSATAIATCTVWHDSHIGGLTSEAVKLIPSQVKFDTPVSWIYAETEPEKDISVRVLNHGQKLLLDGSS